MSAVDSFFQSTDPNAKTKTTKAFQQHLYAGRDQTTRIYISHQVNLSALLGGFAASGAGYLVNISEQGNVEIIGEFSTD